MKTINDVEKMKPNEPTPEDIADLMTICDADNDRSLLDIIRIAYGKLSKRGKWFCIESLLRELRNES